MAESIGARLRKAWNVFTSKEQREYHDYGPVYVSPPGTPRRPAYISDKTIVNAIYNRIALDVAQIDIKHARLDENGRYSEEIKSHLDECLTLQANIDQGSREFIQDCVLTMIEQGCAALVPIETDDDPFKTNAYDIFDMRVGQVVEFRPRHVKVKVFNERLGRDDEIWLPKADVAIVQNPLYTVINAPNSTMQRLLHKLSLLDAVDEANSSGRLDIIIQLPYTVRTELRKKEAEKRKQEIEDQLYNSKYGLAYTDATEKVIQLNRPVENTLWNQIESLTKMLYGQLGLTDEILSGAAKEDVMLNYYNRTIEPFISAICREIKRKFLTEKARADGQSIEFFINHFKFVPVTEISKMADSFTRNEIMTSNEFRQIMGMKPSDDPEADSLRNKNLNPTGGMVDEYGGGEDPALIDPNNLPMEEVPK